MDELYSNWFLGNTTAAANMSTDKMPTIEECNRMIKQFAAMKHEHDRSMADICQKPCPECKRRPVFSNSVLQVCPHIWDWLLQNVRVVNHIGMAEWPSPFDTLCGMRIELFDDGPARF